MKCRSSHQRCSVKKVVLRNFAKLTGKHLCQSLFFNPIQDGPFWDCSQIRGGAKSAPSLKSVTYPTMMKLDTVISYLKKIQKYMNHVAHPLSSADISIFAP